MRGRHGRPRLLGHRDEPEPSPPPAPPAMPAPATPSAEEIELVTQLRQLAQLQQEGILTEAEFAAKKAELLVAQN
ncbi:SHOCT domain-containing protein [Solirubrobacter ginsenosidimutans]|uniref:SHOCT domain-containing protein n=1 Tax=Solirubrobacter ginsenosidimutans TaxID=490573 RepID=A0A9X3MSN5_9ACTN|nr:SHOCT domain-containing protein [Solirubrobacter ginsenosidimutans]MDA0160882.1 SHOCT domain-containing protein [Solirubrobacter ginsenosidimutans]